MDAQPDLDLLGNLRGLLYDWKSAELDNSAKAFIRYAKEVVNKIELCKDGGFDEVLLGIDFYDVWCSHNHTKLLAFVNNVQTVWELYSNRPDMSKLTANECKTLQLFDGCAFKRIDVNTFRLESHTQRIDIDLWKNSTKDGLVTIENSREKLRIRVNHTLIPAQDQEVSEEAINILLNLFPTTQQTKGPHQ